MSTQTEFNSGSNRHLGRYLSPLSVWALSFGCAVGWGAFVMPGTTFLPSAGPLGTALGVGIGAVIMLIIGMNYHYLMNKYPDAGGTLTYSIRAFGYDHGFLSAWFLILVYVAIIWANATALTLIARSLFGDTFQFGFHYSILGYDVYFGEVLLSISAIVLCGLLCIHSKRGVIRLQTVLAVILFAGIVIASVHVFGMSDAAPSYLQPAFAPTSKPPVGQVIHIIALTPWAFVGFESVSNSAAGFKFSQKKTIWIMAGAIFASAAVYILLTLIAASVLPESYADWPAYIRDLPFLGGYKGLPTFFATHAALGGAGAALLGVTTMAAIITGLVGNYIGCSRLIFTMAEDGILPEWFRRLDGDNNPRNAFLFLTFLSLPISLLGRTAIGWIVDVNTIGATIAYGYTSAAAYATAKREGDRWPQATGVFGMTASVLFFIYFMALSAGEMSTESYLILAGWSILGFVFFRVVFSRDEKRRFGKSTVVWIMMLFLIFFTTLMWVRQATQDVTQEVLVNLDAYNIDELSEHGVTLDRAEQLDAEKYLERQMDRVNAALVSYSVVQMALICLSLGIMFSLYTSMAKREKRMEAEKVQAQESSRAKSTFLSNMSHDIRTPMNAILGYTTLARREGSTAEEMRTYLDKIDASGQHLLALINDVLEMSRIESGKMDIELAQTDLKKTLGEVHDMFAAQMAEKQINFTVDASQVDDGCVLCDKNRLNRVLLNLLSNAYKFTPEGGRVAVTLRQTATEEEYGVYELRVRDSGIGMSKEFAEKVFDAFERERTSTVSGIQGTGLGMAITRSIIDLMGGTINMVTAPGQGTEFIVTLKLALAGEAGGNPDEKREMAEELDFSTMHLLLVDDNEINREIATLLLEEAGFTVTAGENGKEAVDLVAASAPGTYDAVLMDVQMPVMGGYEATAAIRALSDPGLANIPIIAMTANAFSEDIQAAKAAGMNAHIAKPVDEAKMIQTICEVLRRR